MYRKLALAAAILACAAFARPPQPLTPDAAKAWLQANAPGWVYLKSAPNGLILSARTGSVDDSAYPTIRYLSRADMATGVISTMIRPVEIDCAASRYRHVGGTAADEGGTTVEVPAETEWTLPQPDSTMGYLHGLMCEDARKKRS